MTRVIYGSCKVNTGSPDSVFILDPCNCTSYYKLISSPVISKERLICESGMLWNYQDDECQPRDHVLKRKLCNERIPWNRCSEISENEKVKIEGKCIKDKYFQPTSGDAFFVNNIHHHLLTRESQLANLELMFASMVAGSVITMMLIALILTFCDWNYFSKKLPGLNVLSRELRRKSIVTRPNITEGDSVSVLYEDVDENDEDVLNSGYRPMSTSDVWQSSSSKTTVTTTERRQRATKPNQPIVRPNRPFVPPDSRSKPESLHVEMSAHGNPRVKKPLPVPPNKNQPNYIHPH